MAKSNDPATWTSFDLVQSAYDPERFAGIGFMFSESDPFCGIDLDGCRNPETGEVSPWAREVILEFASYAEVSPSMTGIKIFCRGKSPFSGGKKVQVDGPAIGGKAPAIEVYDRLRYFAVTGLKVKGPDEPTDAVVALSWLKKCYWPEAVQAARGQDFRSNDSVIERARKYLAKMPPAISGQSGHNATFYAACVLVLGFELGEQDALALMREYNDSCQPKWSESELLHKVTQAAKQTGERGYLRNASPERWNKITVPNYFQKQSSGPAVQEPRITTLADATRSYLESIRNGKATLTGLGISELDYSIGGGVERGEMIIFAARPSHGKSAVALQCLHHWTSLGMPCAIVSEEMSSLALGKRTLQFLSPLPEEHWAPCAADLDNEIAAYADSHAPCIILEGCGSSDSATAAVERVVQNDGVQCVVVDYAQLLRSSGKSRYEQITNTSIALRQLASSQKIILLTLCQLNREIEGRQKFLPMMSDLKDSGQLEQDADVISFLVWPHRINPDEPQGKYQFFVAKNRNRAINQGVVTATFNPARQTITGALPEVQQGYQWARSSDSF